MVKLFDKKLENLMIQIKKYKQEMFMNNFKMELLLLIERQLIIIFHKLK